MTLTHRAHRPTTLGQVIRGHRVGLVAAALLAVVGAACSLAPFVAVYAVTDALFVPGGAGADAVGPVAAGTALAILVGAVAKGASTHVAHVAAYRSLADLRSALAGSLQSQPLGRVQARSTGEVKKILLDDVEQLEEALAHGVPDGAAAAAVPVTTTIVLLVIDWRLALVSIGALLLLVLVSAAGMALAQRQNAALAAHATTLNRAVMGFLQGILVIRGYLRPDTGFDQAQRAVLDARDLQDRQMRGPVRWVVAFMGVGTGLAVALLLPVGGLLHVAGAVDLSTLVLFLLLGLGYLNPILGLVGTLATVLIRIQFAAGSIREILGEEPMAQSDAPRSPTDFDVVLDGVTFGYREGELVVADIDLTVPDGSTLALVGRTGSGKSTIAGLVARFHDVESGAVRIGGVDVREISGTELAQHVAFIQQGEYVFAASLRENIRVARPGATDEEVERAGERAQLGPVVDALDSGWDTELPGGGGSLSGGERQRISIARALLKDARVVVLDEVTASLDAATEARTLDAIHEATRGRTVIAIAHRLSTIRDSDQIAVLDEGRVVATGDHEQLLDRSPIYADLWRAYGDAVGWRLTAAPDPALPLGEGAGPEPVRSPEVVPSEDTVAARTMVRQGVGAMPFARQWRTMYGRAWHPLLRRGLVRLVLEGLVRGAPVAAVFVLVLTAVGEGPWGERLDAPFVRGVSGALAIALVLRLFLSAWANSIVWSLAGRAKADLQLSVLERLRRVPLGFFGRVDSGRTGTLVTNDLPMVDFQNIPQQVVGSLVQPVVSMLILAVIDWRLAAAALIGVPVFWALTVWSDRIHHRVFADVHAARREATTVLIEQARGAAVLRGNPGSVLARRYESAIERLADASISMSVRATPASALGSMAVEAGQVVLIVVGASLYGAGAVPATTFLLFLFLTLTMYQPIQELMLLAGYRRNQQQIATKLGEVWDQPLLPEPERPAHPRDSSVELRDVDFGYDPEDTTLRRVSFRAEPATVTALVGASGAGKTTIAHLISRMWDVRGGSVLIGGEDVRDLGSDEVMRAVAVVHQDVYLFDESVRFNLTLGRPSATEDEVWLALAAARADDFVRELPEGLDSVLQDGGSDLSGGQRQRLAIARAILKDCPVLVLDEAVASVDPDTEEAIQAALATLAAGRTVIVIAHRLSTVVGADQIVVVDDGRVVGSGGHERLLETPGVYRELFAAQQDVAPDRQVLA